MTTPIGHHPSSRAARACQLVLAALAALPVAAVLADSPFTTPGEQLPDLRPVQRLAQQLPNGDPADVYLPRAAPAVRERFRDALPLVVFMQGAFVDKAAYSRVARQIAQRGFVVVVPNHARTLPQFPQPVLFAEVDTVNAVHAAIAEADADPSSPLYLIVDTEHMGLVGHSLGGAVGLQALAGICIPGVCSAPADSYAPPPALEAAVVYGANLFDRRSGELRDLDTSAGAVALIQGSLDGIAATEKAQRSYKALEPPRALIAIEGANHFGICNQNRPAGSRGDPLEPTLPQTRANRAIARLSALWLRAELLDDADALGALERLGSNPEGVVQLIAIEPASDAVMGRDRSTETRP